MTSSALEPGTATRRASLRVWHVNLAPRDLTVDGITHAVARLADAQQGAGHAVSVERTGQGTPLRAARALAARARQERPDVVHLHSVFRPAHAYLAFALHRAGIRYVTSPHSGFAPEGLKRDRVRKRVYTALVERHLMHRAAAVMCLTATESREVLAVAPRSNTAVVANGVAPASAAQAPWAGQPAGSRARVVSLSRFDVWQKGLDRLAAIAAALPEADIVVHGQQDANQPERTAALAQSAPSNFTLASPVFADQKDATLAAASLYVQTSRWEGLSMSVIEAMRAGVPVAVSSYIAASMGLTGTDLAIVLDDDPATAAAQIRAVLANTEELARLGAAGAAHVRTAYDPDMVAAAAVSAYLGLQVQSAQ